MYHGKETQSTVCFPEALASESLNGCSYGTVDPVDVPRMFLHPSEVVGTSAGSTLPSGQRLSGLNLNKGANNPKEAFCRWPKWHFGWTLKSPWWSCSIPSLSLGLARYPLQVWHINPSRPISFLVSQVWNESLENMATLISHIIWHHSWWARKRKNAFIVC